MARVLKADHDGLAEAAALVAKGGLVSYPTDTVYGLGCDPLNSTSVERVLHVKGGRTKGMPVLVRSLDDACRIAHVSGQARRLSQRYWPGPLTIVLPATEVLPTNLVPQGTVGLRCPNHAICLRLLGLCSGFLVGTSANVSGKHPATSAEEVVRELGDRVDIILDGGRAPLGISSTVVDLTKGRPIIMREGPLGRAEILGCLREGKTR